MAAVDDTYMCVTVINIQEIAARLTDRQSTDVPKVKK